MDNKDKLCEFIEKSNLKHNNKYDYSLVKYINTKTKITIICKIHGQFEQRPSNHTSGSGCHKCSIINRPVNKKSNTNEFIIKARLKHNDKYDYSKVNYINDYTKIIIICKEHGEFKQQPNSHLRGTGCPGCSNTRKYTTDDFINRSITIHGNRYDYSKSIYIDKFIKIIIICKEHGEFELQPAYHLKGTGCLKCSKTYSIDKKLDFINKSIDKHNNKYDYSKVIYINDNTKVTIICNIHGEFLQLPRNHIVGSGCPLCINKTEGIILKYLKLNYPNTIYQFRDKWCKNIDTNKYLPFDFCIEEYKVIIELDGRQHFSIVSKFKNCVKKQLERDKYKEKCANDNGYSIIRLIQEDVFNNTYDWKNKLLESVELLKNIDRPKNIYLCTNNEYNKYL
jgi:very-short-patch-repair endonuclease